MIFIVISHAMPDGDTAIYSSAINLGLASENIQYFITGLLHNLGQIGNDIFIVCSAWFLLDSKKTNVKKIASMIGDCFVISVIALIVFLIMGYDLPNLFILKQFMPTTFGNSWFVTCYLIFFAIHPLLNIIINKIDKKGLLLFNAVFIVLYCFLNFFIGKMLGVTLFYYNEVIGFIGIYFMTAYIKRYLPKTSSSAKNNVVVLAIGVAGWLAMSLLTNILGLKIGIFSEKLMQWNKFINPFFLLIAFSLFNIVRQRSSHKKWINYLSSVTLLIYIIHCNRIVRDYLRFDIFEYILNTYSYDNLVLWVLLYALISFIASTILAIIYKETLQRAVKKISVWLCDIVTLLYNKITSHIIKLE